MGYNMMTEFKKKRKLVKEKNPEKGVNSTRHKLFRPLHADLFLKLKKSALHQSIIQKFTTN